jgi:hypothetical protein
VKTIKPIVLMALTFAACGGETPTAITSRPTTTILPAGAAAQGNQSPLPVEGQGICQGKVTFKSLSSDVTYCVLSTDLSLQGDLCHFVKPEDPPTLRHRIGVITGPSGAYLKEPLGFSAPENDCGAVKTENPGTGLILLEEADESGGAEIPPNSEKVLTFAFTRDAAGCGRVQSVADLLTQNGTSLKVAGVVLNYPTACKPDCVTLHSGDSLNEPEFFVEETLFPLGVFFFTPPFTVPAGWTVTVDARTTVPSIESRKDPVSTRARPDKITAFSRSAKKVRAQAFDSVLAAGLDCGDFAVDASSSDGTLHFVQPFPEEKTCSLVIATVDPNTSYFAQKCPGLRPQDRDEGPLLEECGCQ